jgi:hypothetical protein
MEVNFSEVSIYIDPDTYSKPSMVWLSRTNVSLLAPNFTIPKLLQVHLANCRKSYTSIGVTVEVFGDYAPSYDCITHLSQL